MDVVVCVAPPLLWLLLLQREEPRCAIKGQIKAHYCVPELKGAAIRSVATDQYLI